jgi:hypothetical protein
VLFFEVYLYLHGKVQNCRWGYYVTFIQRKCPCTMYMLILTHFVFTEEELRIADSKTTTTTSKLNLLNHTTYLHKPGIFCCSKITCRWFVFSSPDLKAQVSYSDRLLSVVRLSRSLSFRLSVCKRLDFDFFSRTTGPILTKLDTSHPWRKGIQVCSNERDCPSPKGDNSKRVKIHWTFF